VDLRLKVFSKFPGRRRSPRTAGSPGRKELRRELEEESHRKADDVREVALDALDQDRAEALDRVGSGPVTPLPGREVTRDGGGVERSAARPRSGLGPRRARPLTTVWVRPERSSSRSRAPSASAGFPSIVPSRTTSVSTPSARPPVTARSSPAAALRRAFSSTASSTGPSRTSSTCGSTASNSIPRVSRISRRRGEAEARIRTVPGTRARSRGRRTPPSRTRAPGSRGWTGRGRRGWCPGRPCDHR
jgi:hypothetical protein